MITMTIGLAALTVSMLIYFYIYVPVDDRVDLNDIVTAVPHHIEIEQKVLDLSNRIQVQEGSEQTVLKPEDIIRPDLELNEICTSADLITILACDNYHSYINYAAFRLLRDSYNKSLTSDDIRILEGYLATPYLENNHLAQRAAIILAHHLGGGIPVLVQAIENKENRFIAINAASGIVRTSRDVPKQIIHAAQLVLLNALLKGGELSRQASMSVRAEPWMRR